jgi:predicted oxidoreductase (fatty acid repression mutant protein)
VPVIDGVSELRDLLNSDQRVWVIAHSNVKDVLEEPSYRYLDDAFDDFQSNELITVYVNSRDVVGQLQR